MTITGVTQSVKSVTLRLVFVARVPANCQEAVMTPKARNSRGVDSSFVGQQNRDIVPHRVDAAAFATFQAFGVLLMGQRLFANRTNQNIQQVLRNHDRIVLHHWTLVLAE